MTSTHIERYISVNILVGKIRHRLGFEKEERMKAQLLAEMNDLVHERNDLWDALEFRVPEMGDPA